MISRKTGMSRFSVFFIMLPILFLRTYYCFPLHLPEQVGEEVEDLMDKAHELLPQTAGMVLVAELAEVFVSVFGEMPLFILSKIFG